MKEKKLIKLTDATGVNESIYYLGKLPRREENYNHYYYDQKKLMVACISNLLLPEIEQLKEKIKSKNFQPSAKFYSSKEHLPVFTLLLAYFIFLKAYLESFTGFITLYLQDMENIGIDVGRIDKKNKYNNLKKFNLDHKNLDKLNQIRNLSIHSKEQGDYSFAFEVTSEDKLEVCLIKVEYPENNPVEKESYSYELVEIIETVNDISVEFEKYITERLQNNTR